VSPLTDAHKARCIVIEPTGQEEDVGGGENLQKKSYGDIKKIEKNFYRDRKIPMEILEKQATERI
jgi:hypothetical protein